MATCSDFETGGDKAVLVEGKIEWAREKGEAKSDEAGDEAAGSRMGGERASGGDLRL